MFHRVATTTASIALATPALAHPSGDGLSLHHFVGIQWGILFLLGLFGVIGLAALVRRTVSTQRSRSHLKRQG